MKKQFKLLRCNLLRLIILILFLSCGASLNLASQETNGSFWKPVPRNYEVMQSFEVESLVPMFLVGGFHAGIGYRYKKFRFRTSVINGGSFNVDGQALNRGRDGYERYYTWSPGFFFGYNVWKNLEIYTYYEHHTFKILNLLSAEEKHIPSNDFGLAASYQLFIGRYFYIQPGIHTYIRSSQQTVFSNDEVYEMPTLEITPVVRLGVRIFSRFNK